MNGVWLVPSVYATIISYGDLMHSCVSYAGYFLLWLVRKHTIWCTTFMFTMMLCEPFSSMVSGSPLMSELAWWAHARVCEPCVEKYYTSNFAHTRKLPKAMPWCFENDRSHHNACVCSFWPKLLTEYLLKYSSHVPLLFFQVKASHSYTDDNVPISVKVVAWWLHDIYFISLS